MPPRLLVLPLATSKIRQPVVLHGLPSVWLRMDADSASTAEGSDFDSFAYDCTLRYLGRQIKSAQETNLM